MQLRGVNWAIVAQPPVGNDVVFASTTKRDAVDWLRCVPGDERRYMKLLEPEELRATRGWVGDMAHCTGLRSQVWHHKDYPGTTIHRVFVGKAGLRRYQVNGTPDDSRPVFGTILEAKHHVATIWSRP